MKDVRRRLQAARALRPVMRSPGRPPGWRREHVQRFWDGIAQGLSSEEAIEAAGLSQAVGSRWFRESGGMRTVPTTLLSGRYLSFVEREEIAVLNAQSCAVREIGRRVGRSPSTISRELRRNAATRSVSGTQIRRDDQLACRMSRGRIGGLMVVGPRVKRRWQAIGCESDSRSGGQWRARILA
jgi:hypothetical protein